MKIKNCEELLNLLENMRKKADSKCDERISYLEKYYSSPYASPRDKENGKKLISCEIEFYNGYGSAIEDVKTLIINLKSGMEFDDNNNNH